MIDAIPPHSHYEYALPVPRSYSTEKVKQKAYKSMVELEGWCSEQKASTLMELVFMMRPEKVVEIGVFGGKSLVPIAFALKEMDQGAVYGIDPWSAHASSEGMEGVNYDYWSKVDHEAILQGLKQKIKKFRLEDHIVLIRKSSEEAPLIEGIDILHIDGNHSEEASFLDVTKWVPLVRRGGIIIFDDINWATTAKAVEWLDSECIKMTEITGDNIWGIWVKP